MSEPSVIPFPPAALRAADEINHLAAAGIPFIFVFDFELQRPIVCKLSDAANRGIYYNFRGISNSPAAQIPFTKATPSISCAAFQIVNERYEQAYLHMQRHLSRGDIYLINLTQKIPITSEYTLAEIFIAASAPYRLLIADQCVVFSPEPFVRITDRQILTFPMKGTIAADAYNAENELLRDPKEAAEHATVVDLLRNDLSMVASNVRVDRYQYIEKITTASGGLLQASTQISGVLPENFRDSLGNLLCTLLPAGSISGAPKREALKIIADVEGEPRGYYTGVCGIYDGRNLESAVMIRFIEQEAGRYYFRSGGGITFQSDGEREYLEMLGKVTIPLEAESHIKHQNMDSSRDI